MYFAIQAASVPKVNKLHNKTAFKLSFISLSSVPHIQAMIFNVSKKKKKVKK